MTRNKLLNLVTLAGLFGVAEVTYRFETGEIYRVYFNGVAYGQDADMSFEAFGKMVKARLSVK